MGSEWREVTLGEISERMTSGGTPSTRNESFYGGDVPWLRTQEINFNKIYDTEIKISQAGLESSSAKLIPKNSVIIAMYGATAGKSAINKIPLTTNQACCNIILDDLKTDYQYVYYSLLDAPRSTTVSGWHPFASGLRYSDLASLANGAAQQNLSIGSIKNFKIPLPPLPIQRQIAAILSAFDDTIELNRQMNRTLEQMARALFKSWFVDFDPVRAKMRGEVPEGMDAETAALFPDELVEVEGREVPEGWAWQTVDQLYKLYGGSTPSTINPDYWEGGEYHWSSPKDMSGLDVPFLTHTDKKITQAGTRVISSGLLPSGTLLLSSRAPVGYMAIADMPISINQGYIALESTGPLGRYFTLNLLQSRLDEIKAMASGTTFPELSKKTFRQFEVLVPNSATADAFEGIVGELYEKLRKSIYESAHVAQLRDVLLPRLLSGDVDVGDWDVVTV